jgi:hypothetical protein
MATFNRSFEDVCLRWRTSRQLCVSASAAVFWLVSFSASADRRGRHPQSRLILLAVSALSLDQPLVGQALALCAAHKTIEPGHGVVLDVALVQPEGKFVNVAIKMFRAGMVVDANQPALEYRENAFHSVRGHAVTDILACAMVDRSVFEARTLDADIRASFVGVQDRTGLNVLIDGGLDRLFVGACDRHADSATPALAHSENGGLADRPASGLELLGLVLVLFDAAYIGFVDFDDAFELAQVVTAAGFAQAVQHKPSRLLSDTDFLGELHAGDALAGRHKQVHRVNPFMEGNVAALEYRASAHREVLLALVAAIEAFLANCDALFQAADRAFRTIRPKAAFKVRPGRFLIREHFEKLECGNCALGHGLTPDLWAEHAPKTRGSQVYNSRKKGP